jgi:hypothetical protein
LVIEGRNAKRCRAEIWKEREALLIRKHKFDKTSNGILATEETAVGA